jgi:hypothetical protein
MIVGVVDQRLSDPRARCRTEERITIKDFAVFDADSHVVEPPALCDKYLDAEYRAPSPARAVSHGRGV